jgi:predicted NBD/HSP70 family sugar kinase
MSQNFNSVVAVIGIDIGKNTFHVVGLDGRGGIVLRQSVRNPPKSNVRVMSVQLPINH